MDKLVKMAHDSREEEVHLLVDVVDGEDTDGVVGYDGTSNPMCLEPAFGDFGKDDGKRVSASVRILVCECKEGESEVGEGVAEEFVHCPELESRIEGVEEFAEVEAVGVRKSPPSTLPQEDFQRLLHLNLEVRTVHPLPLLEACHEDP